LGVAILAAYFLTTGLIARHHLERAKDDVSHLQYALLASDNAAAHRWMAAAQSNAKAAHRWLAGPAWGAAAHIPWAGRPARTARGLADVAVSLADDALPPVVRAGDILTPSHLRTSDGAIRLGIFRSAAAPLAAAATAADAAAREVAQLPGSSWLPAANDARHKASSLIGTLQGLLQDAGDASRLAPDMLGGAGTRRYLLVVENDAEARGLGGLPGVTAVLTISNGRMSIGDFHNNSFLGGASAPLAGLPPDFRHTYAGVDVASDFRDSDVSPDFPVAAKIWLGMWQDATGQRLDGAIAADPTALSYLLGATGAAKLADGTEVSSDNVVALTEKDIYADVRPFAVRQERFIEIAKAAASQVVDAPHGSAHDLVKAMSRAVNEHRLLVYSSDRREQATLAATPLAGALPRTDAPFVGVVINNGQASKLDYYVERSVTYDRTGCSVSGLQLSTVTVQLRNTAPAGLPAFVTHRDRLTRNNPLGSERLFVALYTTQGAQSLGVTQNGTKLITRIGSEVGHSRYEVDVTINRGSTATLVFHLIEPKSDKPVQIWKQPGVQPQAVSLTGKRCD
jgi:hypothetical protein